MHRASVASQPATYEQLSPVPEAGAKAATTKQLLASIKKGQTTATLPIVLGLAPGCASVRSTRAFGAIQVKNMNQRKFGEVGR